MIIFFKNVVKVFKTGDTLKKFYSSFPIRITLCLYLCDESNTINCKQLFYITYFEKRKCKE